LENGVLPLCPTHIAYIGGKRTTLGKLYGIKLLEHFKENIGNLGNLLRAW
jgi:hypothetical protein